MSVSQASPGDGQQRSSRWGFSHMVGELTGGDQSSERLKRMASLSAAAASALTRGTEVWLNRPVRPALELPPWLQEPPGREAGSRRLPAPSCRGPQLQGESRGDTPPCLSRATGHTLDGVVWLEFTLTSEQFQTNSPWPTSATADPDPRFCA